MDILEKILITDTGTEGHGIARVPSGKESAGELVIFVEGGIPGDVADIRILRKKKNYAEAGIVKIHTSSEKRNIPFCSHFGTCGGCRWQHMNYEAQLFYKHKQVSDAMERIAEAGFAEILPVIPSEATTCYRNKLEFSFSDKGWIEADLFNKESSEPAPALGFHVPKKFDRILDVAHCFLQPEPSNKIRLAVKEYAILNRLSFFNARQQTGLLRNLIIRNSVSGGEVMLGFVFSSEEKQIFPLMNHVSELFSSVASVLYFINPKKNDTLYDLPVHIFKGKDYITEDMNGIKFRIGIKSFFQTNTAQAKKLFEVVKDFAGLGGTENVYDLYTGIGSIAGFIAGHAKKITGIDSVPEAIENAKENALLNNIGNASFYAGDVKDIITADFIKENGRPDVIITDPPRAGMHERVTEKIMELMPARLIYVSCNPSTQARDVKILKDKFSIRKMQPVDMFPHTQHVENVLLMEAK